MDAVQMIFHANWMIIVPLKGKDFWSNHSFLPGLGICDFK